MKIGIITFHSAHNYGAVLQAYALSNALSNMGHDAEIIDYRPKFIRDLYSINILDKLFNLKSILSLVLMYPVRISRFKKFEDFIKYKMKLSLERYNSSFEITNNPPLYEAYIAGSDQIWNPGINGVMGEYFLEFVKDKDSKKISYAASFGSKKLEDRFNDEISKKLIELNSISVREDDGVHIIESLINESPQHVLDPVFLLSVSDWNRIIIKPKIDFKYVLIYMMEYNEEIITLANKIAEEKDIKILNLSNAIKVSKGIYKNIRNAGPEEYLGLLFYADYVVTNSFHGTSFSIIFEKNFFVIPHSKLNSRIENILSIVGLENRQILDVKEKTEVILSNLNTNKARVKILLQAEISSSKEYLTKALGKQVDGVNC